MTTIEDNIKNENINKINNEFEINNELNVSNIPYFYDYGYTSIVINQILEINNFTTLFSKKSNFKLILSK